MLLPVFQDLIKPQWRGVLEALKQSGGMSVGELAHQTEVSYMAAKSHCEDLTKAGYVIRARLPRTEVGRPEIFYSLSEKADALFPQAGIEFTLALLDDLKRMSGDSAPEKLLFQHFQRQQETWAKALAGLVGLEAKATKLAKLREKEGHASTWKTKVPGFGQLIELHNPLQKLFEQYPRAATMELRMLEELLGCKLTRQEIPTGREGSPQVVFEVK